MSDDIKKDLDELTAEVHAPELKPGQANPLASEEDQLSPDEIRLIYDDEGNLVGMGQFGSDFEIRHRRPFMFEYVDSVDIEAVNEMWTSKHNKETIKPLDKVSRCFKEFAENSFLALLKDDPVMVSNPTPSQQYMWQALTKVTTEQKFKALSKKCTGDKIKSAMAAMSLTKALSKVITPEALQAVEAMDDINDSMSEVLKEMQEFLQDARAQCGGGQPGTGEGPECPGCGERHPPLQPQTPEQMGMSADEARQKMKEMTQKIGELQEKFNEKLEENRERFESIAEALAKEAPAQAKEKVDQFENMVSGFGTDPGELVRRDMESTLKLMKRYEEDPKLKKLLDSYGRMTNFARKVERRITENAPNTTREPVKLDDDMRNLMQHERVASRHNKLRPDFKARMVNQELACLETDGEEIASKGPMVFCMDTSGSMEGQKITWASALFLTMASRMAKKRRESVLINFASRGQVKADEFPKGTSFVNYIDAATFMYNGGTDFEAPLGKALEFIKTSKYDEADIIFLTDGESDVSKEFLTEFLRAKKQRQFKVLTILINIGYVSGDYVVKQFSDDIQYLTDLQKDEDILATAFAI